MGKKLVVAGTQSGSGKTLVTLAVMAAFTQRGLSVQPFKCGPDFIDPGFHSLVTGKTSHNLDSWMLTPQTCRNIFQQAVADAPDLAIIEGVMGLYDGASGSGDAGSTAQIAKCIDAPVLLVIDGRSMARSFAAIAHGFTTFDAELTVAGCIANRVGSANHKALISEAMATYCPDVPLLGCLPRNEALTLPSRHLGLVMAQEGSLSPDAQKMLAGWAEENLDLDLLLSLLPDEPVRHSVLSDSIVSVPDCQPASVSAQNAPANEDAFLQPDTASDPQDVATSTPESFVSTAVLCDPAAKGSGAVFDESWCAPEGKGIPQPQVTIAVARDEAFCFCYQENLRLLEASGAKLSFFSPLRDTALPEGTDGVYLPGGYPELYAERLSSNVAMRTAIAACSRSGAPVYAECGGLMYLSGSVVVEGREYPMCAVFDIRCTMDSRFRALGYREIVTVEDTLLGRSGTVARGHEFHYSYAEAGTASFSVFSVTDRKGAQTDTVGYRTGNTVGSYVHLHFASNLHVPQSFGAACASFRNRS
ncbi:MAG: cobyrinate a,c-diamide synthase [Desulfovibrionales bacterium]|nr:cobyrinate a,c-diamide synthase [Desulfovibrionales bacterium]